MVQSPLTDRPSAVRAVAHRTACVVLGVVLAFPGAAPAFAEKCPWDQVCGVSLESGEVSRTAAPDISARSGLIITDTGRVLWSRKADKRRAMASTTKIMTGLLVLERADLDERVTVSAKAARTPYGTGLRAGERISVRELLELALVTSSNDACVVLAEHVSGSLPEFVVLMNRRAKELGLDDTHYKNPHGLDAKGHYSSAADLALLARVAMENPEFKRIVALRGATLPEHKDRPARTIKSTDALLRSYPGILGIKTGYTDDAKYSFVTSAKRDGITLTAVILGAPSSSARFKHSAKLLDWAFEHLVIEPVATTTETVGTASIARGAATVPLRVTADTSVPLFTLAGPTSREVSVSPDVELPVFAGQPLGVLTVRQAEQVVATATAVAAVDVASVEATVATVPVAEYLDRTVDVLTTGDTVDVAEYDTTLPVKRSVDLGDVHAPLTAGEAVGEIRYTQGDRVVARVPLVSAVAVEAPTMLERVGIWFGRGWRAITGQPTQASARVMS